MKILSRALSPVALIAVWFLLVAGAGFCEEKPQLFTNEDADKYRRPSDNRPQAPRKIAPPEREDRNRKAHEQKEQEYWCKRATLAKKKIEQAGRDVQEQEKEISQEKAKSVRTSGKIKTLQGRLRKAKDHLASAEGDLTDIEQEAHRRGVRPGWLRCQFD